MSDEQRELGRDASASTDRSPNTDQHPVPSYVMAGGPGPDEPQQGAAQPGLQPGPQQGPLGPQGPQGPQPGAGAYGTPYGAPYGAEPYGSTQEIRSEQPGQPGVPLGPAFPPPGGHSGPPTALMPEQPRKRRTMTGIVAAAIIAGIVGGGAGFGGAYALLGHDVTSGTTLLGATPQSSDAVSAPPGTVAAAAQKAMPSTVDIRVELSQGIAEGSGVVLDAQGDILTNNHVVAGSTGQIQVTMADGSQHPATVVGTSPSYDIAVIRLQGASNLTPATLGQSSALQVGQPVVAIGSPQGLTGTVTTGIISAFNRTVTVQGEDGQAVVYNGLQTDAPINQGNSGGPLVNLDGQVVGINSAIETAGQSTGSIGLGFAIPIDQARRVAQEIISNGVATKPVLGVQGNANSDSDNGAQIAQVQPNSPAASAGLAAGDVVTKVGDTRVENFSDLIARIGSYAPGQQVALTVTDGNGGNQRTVNVTLGSQPDKAANTSSGGQNQNPFGGRNPFGSQNPFGGQNPFGERNPFGGGN